MSRNSPESLGFVCDLSPSPLLLSSRGSAVFGLSFALRDFWGLIVNLQSFIQVLGILLAPDIIINYMCEDRSVRGALSGCRRGVYLS